jgi:hypothetical protein
VGRTAKLIGGSATWVYWCSCDPSRAELVESIASSVSTLEDGFFVDTGECIHVSATKYIVSTIDELQDIHPDQEFTGTSICIYKSAILLRSLCA